MALFGDGESSPRFVREMLAENATAVLPNDRRSLTRASELPYRPPPNVSTPYGFLSAAGGSDTIFTTAPWREPPNSAGNAPVKTSTELMLRGSISSEKLELVL